MADEWTPPRSSMADDWMPPASSSHDPRPALDRARSKAYRRLMPLLFLSYLVAYVDRSNVGIAKLTMVDDLPGFDSEVFGFGAGVFFLGYFLLEVPGTLIVERWSARKWLSRIMVSWGIMAGLTALVTVPWHFYVVRFLLGLSEAGFYPGVIVYLTHWFPSRDRTRALAYFFVATPIAQMISPKLSNFLLVIGTDETINGMVVHHPEVWGLHGWQWVYIAWAVPAVVLGFLVLAFLTDKPSQARWLDPEEREALEAELRREKEISGATGHMTLGAALSNPKVLILAGAYFCAVTGNYGVEFFMPSILERWYELKMDALTWLVVLPPLGSLIGQLFVGWNSDRTGERRFHTVVPIYLGAASLAALAIIPAPPLAVTIGLFFLALTGLKAYLPAFWSLPNLFLAESAAAGSIGFINSVGNLGGFIGPWVLGRIDRLTGSYRGGLTILAVSIALAATIILVLGVGRRSKVGGSSPALASGAAAK